MLGSFLSGRHHYEVSAGRRSSYMNQLPNGRNLSWPSFRSKTLHLVLFLFFLAFLTMVLLRNFAGLALLQYATPILGVTDATPESLNPQLTNTIPDNGGPVLYYNGSGPVPPFVSYNSLITNCAAEHN